MYSRKQCWAQSRYRALSETNSIPICRGNSWNTRNHTAEITRAMAAAMR